MVKEILKPIYSFDHAIAISNNIPYYPSAPEPTTADEPGPAKWAGGWVAADAECAGAGDSVAHSPTSGIFRDGGDPAGTGDAVFL